MSTFFLENLHFFVNFGWNCNDWLMNADSNYGFIWNIIFLVRPSYFASFETCGFSLLKHWDAAVKSLPILNKCRIRILIVIINSLQFRISNEEPMAVGDIFPKQQMTNSNSQTLNIVRLKNFETWGEAQFKNFQSVNDNSFTSSDCSTSTDSKNSTPESPPETQVGIPFGDFWIESF